MKYRKKPVVIEAIQWAANIDSFNEIKNFGAPISWNYIDDHLNVETLEGVMRCNVWDYVIKGVKSEFYPCNPDIFEMTYELVE